VHVKKEDHIIGRDDIRKSVVASEECRSDVGVRFCINSDFAA